MNYFTCKVDDRITYKFAQHDLTVLPKLQDNLADARKRAKAEMKLAPPDSFLRSALDAKQLSIKLSMNASYGFLAAQRMRCKPTVGGSLRFAPIRGAP